MREGIRTAIAPAAGTNESFGLPTDLLIQEYPNGRMTAAVRPREGGTWGPPVELTVVEDPAEYVWVEMATEYGNMQPDVTIHVYATEEAARASYEAFIAPIVEKLGGLVEEEDGCAAYPWGGERSESYDEDGRIEVEKVRVK